MKLFKQSRKYVTMISIVGLILANYVVRNVTGVGLEFRELVLIASLAAHGQVVDHDLCARVAQHADDLCAIGACCDWKIAGRMMSRAVRSPRPSRWATLRSLTWA